MAKKPKKEKTPKPSKPWDDPPTKANGDDSPVPLFQAVGYALTCWERLDEALASLFNELVQSRQGEALAAYGIVSSSASRSSMILVAIAYLFPSGTPLRNQIESTLSEIGHLAGKRNNIAHGVVSSVHATMTHPGGQKKSTGHYLIPAHYLTRKALSPDEITLLLQQDPATSSPIMQKYAYTADQIRDFAEHFNAYRHRVLDLQDDAIQQIASRWPLPALREQELLRQIEDLQTKLSAQSQESPPESSQE